MLNGLKFQAKASFIRRALSACEIVLTIFVFAVPARADEISTDPFAFDASHWISFDHYKEKTRNGKPFVEDAPAPPVVVTPVVAAPALAAPSRPLNPPLMPGVNKDFDVEVSSTEDYDGPMAQIANLENQPTVQIPAFSWQNASNAAKQYAVTPGDTGADHPLDVRMSYLPDSNLAPFVKPNPDSTKTRVARAIAQKRTPKTDDNAAAIAAVAAYKKMQLEAIQSDRQTLEALQAAIAQLGLQKQLNFAAGANGSVAGLDTPSDQPSLKMDFPAPPVK